MLRPLTALPGSIGLLMVLAPAVDSDDDDVVKPTDVDDELVDEVAVALVVPLMAVGEAFLDVDAKVALANDSAIDDSGGHKFVVCTSPLSKWKQSKTAAPTELRLATIELTIVHLLRRIS